MKWNALGYALLCAFLVMGGIVVGAGAIVMLVSILVQVLGPFALLVLAVFLGLTAYIYNDVKDLAP